MEQTTVIMQTYLGDDAPVTGIAELAYLGDDAPVTGIAGHRNCGRGAQNLKTNPTLQAKPI
jgi:hypothetical protein